MPYIIRVPGVPRPYITNDPSIYLDGLNIFHWDCEARPFSDSYCRALRDEEEERFEGDKRCEQLQEHWLNELHQRKAGKAEYYAGTDPVPIVRSKSFPTPVEIIAKDAKRDPVLKVIFEVKELTADDLD
ncbi:hypothetical protein ACN47E_009195 [Coniothyrium glycines]